jgi:hypothetical protein
MSSLRASPGARAYYDQLRARKISHQASTRAALFLPSAPKYDGGEDQEDDGRLDECDQHG